MNKHTETVYTKELTAKDFTGVSTETILSTETVIEDPCIVTKEGF